jgi:hypothetical protein
LYEHDRNVESEIKNGKNERCKIFEYFLRDGAKEKCVRSWGRLQDYVVEKALGFKNSLRGVFEVGENLRLEPGWLKEARWWQVC